MKEFLQKYTLLAIVILAVVSSVTTTLLINLVESWLKSS